MKKAVFVTLAVLIVFSCGTAFAQVFDEEVFVPGFGPFVPRFGILPCFLGGQLLIGGELDLDLGLFDLLLLRNRCLFQRPFELEFGEEDSTDSDYMTEGLVNAKGSFSKASEKVVEINMTSTIPLTFTHEDKVFKVNCVQIVKGLFDLELEEFDGDINVACNGLGKVKKPFMGLASEILPH